MERRKHRIRAIVTAGVVACVATACIKWEAPSTQAVAHPAGTNLYANDFWPGDIDGDGLEDLVGRVWVPGTPTTPGTYAGIILFSDGDGTFTQVDFPAGRWPDQVADLDEDGIDDVVAVGPGAPFSSASLPSELLLGGPAAGSRPRGLSPDDTVPLPDARVWDVGDFDSDGHLDLLRAWNIDSYFERYDPWLNDGTATFTEHAELGVTAGPTNAGGGGYLIYRHGGVDLLHGFLANDPGGPPWGVLPGYPVWHADLNGDGSDDWAAVVAGELRFWDGWTDAAFPDYQDLTVTGTLQTVDLVDLDGDGMVDVTYLDDAGRHTFSGTGDGGFPYESVGDHAPAGRAVWVDLDGDGLVDAVSESPDRQSFVVNLNRSTPVD